MPELPEVETVRKGLLNKIQGKKILSCKVLYPGIIAMPSVQEFEKNLKNQEIKDIKRRGKFLLIELSDYVLVSHLRMEGKYFIKKENDELSKHDHVIFKLNDENELRYNDTRKFGKMYLVKETELSLTPLNDLGKEPWDDTLNVSYLKEKFNKNIAIKTLLLDQSIITGIGNIYADEILFKCRINPVTLGKKLKKKDLENIIESCRSILNDAIEMGGTTIHTYTSVDGITGRFQQKLLVHGKETCSVCHNKIIKIKVNGRGTYYCPNCLKEKRN